jgi:hypothetical protein
LDDLGLTMRPIDAALRDVIERYARHARAT